MFGHASEQHAIEPGAAVSRDNRKIDLRSLGFSTDFFNHISGADFSRPFHIVK